jgi:hypothetical protein
MAWSSRLGLARGHHSDLFLGDGWRLFDEVVKFVL